MALIFRREGAKLQIYKGNISELTQEDYRKGFEMMSDERKKAILRFRSEKDRKRSVLGELLARKGISEFCDIPQEDIEFAREESGKPFAKNVDVEFNISHSKDKVVCVVSRKKVGVDIEKIRDIDMRITKIACTERDKAFIFGKDGFDCDEINPDTEMNYRFFVLWTAKEAYFKYCGSGISQLRTVDYAEIEPFCKVFTENGYVMTIFSK